jgi:curli biogenesis system outer membrane secretion channel CsgG
MERNKLLFPLLLAAVFLTSCASETLVLKQNYDFTRIKRIAVVNFRDSTLTQNTGAMVSQLFMKYLLKAGYNVVERDELDALLREKKLSDSNLLDPSTYKELKLSGIDALVTGSVTKAVAEQDYYTGGSLQFIAAQAAVTVRMIDSQTGEIVWAGADTYDGMNTQTAFDYLASSIVRQMVGDVNQSIKSTKK